MTRRQEGYIYKKDGYWYVRFRQLEELPDGRFERRQRAVRLAPVEAPYRSHNSVKPLRDELFARLKLNSPTEYNVHSTMTLSQFVGQHFFPRHVAYLKPSVRGPLEYNWRKHLEPLCGQIRLRDFRTCDGQGVIDELAGRGLGRNPVKKLKNLLSGIFRQAIRLGALDGANAMREASIPTAILPPPRDTHAYSIEDIRGMLTVFGEPARTIMATFAYTGMRKGEVEALRWEHWHDEALWVEESHWRGHFTEPKSAKSKAPISVIAPLARILSTHRNGQSEGLMFRSRRGTPLNLDNLAKRDIRPTLRKAGLEWHGWHAFRRGLATNLKQLGVDDKTIQAILRHGNYSTTMNSYVKSVPQSVQEAMKRYEQLVCTSLCTEEELRVV